MLQGRVRCVAEMTIDWYTESLATKKLMRCGEKFWWNWKNWEVFALSHPAGAAYITTLVQDQNPDETIEHREQSWRDLSELVKIISEQKNLFASPSNM